MSTSFGDTITKRDEYGYNKQAINATGAVSLTASESMKQSNQFSHPFQRRASAPDLRPSSHYNGVGTATDDRKDKAPDVSLEQTDAQLQQVFNNKHVQHSFVSRVLMNYNAGAHLSDGGLEKSLHDTVSSMLSKLYKNNLPFVGKEPRVGDLTQSGMPSIPSNFLIIKEIDSTRYKIFATPYEDVNYVVAQVCKTLLCGTGSSKLPISIITDLIVKFCHLNGQTSNLWFEEAFGRMNGINVEQGYFSLTGDFGRFDEMSKRYEGAMIRTETDKEWHNFLSQPSTYLCNLNMFDGIDNRITAKYVCSVANVSTELFKKYKIVVGFDNVVTAIESQSERVACVRVRIRVQKEEENWNITGDLKALMMMEDEDEDESNIEDEKEQLSSMVTGSTASGGFGGFGGFGGSGGSGSDVNTNGLGSTWMNMSRRLFGLDPNNKNKNPRDINMNEAQNFGFEDVTLCIDLDHKIQEICQTYGLICTRGGGSVGQLRDMLQQHIKSAANEKLRQSSKWAAKQAMVVDLELGPVLRRRNIYLSNYLVDSEERWSRIFVIQNIPFKMVTNDCAWMKAVVGNIRKGKIPWGKNGIKTGLITTLPLFAMNGYIVEIASSLYSQLEPIQDFKDVCSNIFESARVTAIENDN